MEMGPTDGHEKKSDQTTSSPESGDNLSFKPHHRFALVQGDIPRSTLKQETMPEVLPKISNDVQQTDEPSVIILPVRMRRIASRLERFDEWFNGGPLLERELAKVPLRINLTEQARNLVNAFGKMGMLFAIAGPTMSIVCSVIEGFQAPVIFAGLISTSAGFALWKGCTAARNSLNQKIEKYNSSVYRIP